MLNDHVEPARRNDLPALDIGPAAWAVLRVVVLVAGCGLLLFGLWCGWDVFSHLRRVVQGGQNLEDAARPIGEAIQSDRIEVTIPNKADPVPIGPTISVLLLFLWNLLWIYLPVLMIKTGAWLMMLAIPARSADHKQRLRGS